MSFYIKEYKNIGCRDIGVLAFSTQTLLPYVEHLIFDFNDKYNVFYCRNIFCCKYIIKTESIKNDIFSILKFAKSRRTNSIEIIVDKDSLIATIEQCSNFLLNEEFDIGLLVSDRKVITNNIEFLKNNGVFISNSIIDDAEMVVGIRPIHKCVKHYSIEDNGSEICGAARPYKQEKSKYKLNEKGFKDKLIHYLNKSNKTGVQVYTKGGITKQVFSKAISNNQYIPKKGTILCMIIGMELCLDDALDLLNAAGFTLSDSILSDVIIKEFIVKMNFDIEEINVELDNNNEKPIGWQPRED